MTSTNAVIWIYDFAGATQFTTRSYSLTSANDAPERDPRDFFLEGSINGTTWTVVDSVFGHQFVDQPSVGNNSDATHRFETYFFTVDTPNVYSLYQLRVIETFGTTNDRPQIAEIQLFDTIVVPEPTATGLILSASALLFLRRRSTR